MYAATATFYRETDVERNMYVCRTYFENTFYSKKIYCDSNNDPIIQTRP